MENGRWIFHFLKALRENNLTDEHSDPLDRWLPWASLANIQLGLQSGELTSRQLAL